MRNAIIGHTGFVGSNLCKQYIFTDFYNSKTIEEIKGQSFDLLVCAGVRAEKWLANKNPKEDLNQILRLIDCLKDVKCNNAILISTVDVYDKISNVNENYYPNFKNHPYGCNRLFLEHFFQTTFYNHNIVRLPALFGEGLKKNAIYDFLNNNETYKIDSRNSFQFYNISNLFNDIISKCNNSVVNLVTEPISIEEIAKKCFDNNFYNSIMDKQPISYDIKTVFSNNGYFYSKDEIIKDMSKFVKEYKK